MVAGTGLHGWELIATWHALSRDEAQFHAAYDWLTDAQRRAALNYYALYPDEIDRRLAAEERWTAERMRDELPFTSLGVAPVAVRSAVPPSPRTPPHDDATR